MNIKKIFESKQNKKIKDLEKQVAVLSDQCNFLYLFLEATQEKKSIKPINVIRKHQLKILEILLLFDKICRKYSIPYWLEGGTLLGAVRHGGFVPWDDDIDISLLRSDYNKLSLEILPKELEKTDYYSFIDGINDRYLGLPFQLGRVKKNNMIGYIDYFPYDFYYKRIENNHDVKEFEDIQSLGRKEYEKYISVEN